MGGNKKKTKPIWQNRQQQPYFPQKWCCTKRVVKIRKEVTEGTGWASILICTFRRIISKRNISEMPNCETPSIIKWMTICWVLHLKKTTTKQFLRALGMWYLPFVWYFLRRNTRMDTLGVAVHWTFVRAPLPGLRGQLLWRRWARAPLLFHQRSITFRCRACTGVSVQTHQSHVFKNAFCF